MFDPSGARYTSAPETRAEAGIDEEEQRGGVNWKRFDEDKLYRALMTERGLPPPLPVGYQIDVPRFRQDRAYRTMIDARGFTFSPEREAELRSIAEERRHQRRGSPGDIYDEGPPKVVGIADPRFRVRRPAVLSTPRWSSVSKALALTASRVDAGAGVLVFESLKIAPFQFHRLF